MLLQNSTQSFSALIAVTVISTLITLTVVFTLVLPVFYGLESEDLARFFKNRWLNRADLAAARDSQLGSDSIPVQSATSLRTVTPLTAPPAPAQDSLIEERNDKATLVVLPGQQLIYWLVMERDYQLDYSWHTDGKPLYSEFRGERNEPPANRYEIFKKTTKPEAGGLFISPFSGKFGWLWVNKTGSPIKVQLTVKGEYQIFNEPA